MVVFLRIELRRLLVTFGPWLLIALSQGVLGLVFILSLADLAQEPALARSRGPTAYLTSQVLGVACLWLLLMAPLLATRVLYETREPGTAALLHTGLASPFGALAGKLGAVTVILSVITGLAVAMPASLAIAAPVDWGVLLSTLIHMALLVVMYASVGLAAAALVPHGAAATAMAAGILLLLWLLYWPASDGGQATAVLRFLSPSGHMEIGFGGLLSLEAIAALMLIAMLALIVAWVALAAGKGGSWHARRRPLAMAVLLALGAAALAGLAAGRAQSWDLSQSGRHRLTESSRQILAAIAQPIWITAALPAGSPLKEPVRLLVERYRLAGAEIHLRFKTPQAVATRLSRLGVDAPWALIVEIDGRQEVCTELGEPCLSAALMRAAERHRWWLGFITGHGERPLTERSPGGLSRLREILQRQGYSLGSLNLAETGFIPDNTEVLVVAGATDPFLPVEIELLRRYLTEGGNLLWLTDPPSGEPAWAEALPLAPDAGVIVSPDYTLLGTGHPAIAPIQDFARHPLAQGMTGRLLMAWATPVIARDHPSWHTRVLARSLSRTWAERDTGNASAQFDPSDGDRAGPLVVAMTATREMARGEQRLALIGDSDLFTNRFITDGENRRLAERLFRWLASSRVPKLAGAEPKPASFALSPGAVRAAAFIYIVVLPALALMTGAMIRRRRRD